MTDESHLLYEHLWEKIHDLVDFELRKLPEEESEDIRTKLTEEFRFWKR
jgi:hypothetical protein